MPDDHMRIDPGNVESINRWLDDHPGISGREAARQLGINESYIRRAKAARPKGTIMRLKISDIRRDSSTQPRVAIDPDTVERYQIAKREGAKFRPAVVFFDGRIYRMGDGFHRTAADEALGVAEVEVEVREGNARDAYLHGVVANLQNGLPLTRKDRRSVVMWYFDDPQSAKLSNRAIAKLVGVDEKMVRIWRDEWNKQDEPEPVADHPAPEVDPDPAPPTPSLAVHRPKPQAEAPPEPAAPPDFEGEENEAPAKLTDDEWLDTLPVRAKLAATCRAVFDRDALLFRDVTDTDHYRKFEREAKRALDDKGSVGLRGWYHARLSSFQRTKHPRAWLMCSACKGKGCETCKRRGYVLP